MSTLNICGLLAATTAILVVTLAIVKWCYLAQLGQKAPKDLGTKLRWEKLLAFPVGLETLCALAPKFFTPDAPEGDDAVYNKESVVKLTPCYPHALATPAGTPGKLGGTAFDKGNLEEKVRLGAHPHSPYLLSMGTLKQARLRLKAEGLKRLRWNNLFQNRYRRGVILFVFDPGSNSCHFFKLNQNGWSSKAGELPATRIDDRGKGIRNPRLAVLDGYRYVTVGAYVVNYDKCLLRVEEATERGIAVEALSIH